MKYKTIFPSVMIAAMLALPMQANADVFRCYAKAQKSEAKGLMIISKGVTRACKTKGTPEQVSAKIGKLAFQVNAKLQKLADKNNKLDDKFGGACDGFGSQVYTFLLNQDAFGAGQATVPSAGSWEGILMSEYNQCNAE